MRLLFQTKPNPSVLETICQELLEFILANTVFLDLTLSVLGRRRFADSAITRRLPFYVGFQNVEKHRLLKEYRDLIHQLYNTDDISLSVRRGQFLELLAERMGPTSLTTAFNTVREANVLIDDQPVSAHDIDVVFHAGDADLVECKATLKGWMQGLPLPTDVKDKLKFLQTVKQHVRALPANCVVQLLTYLEDDALVTHMLKPAFWDFQVRCRPDILRKIC